MKNNGQALVMFIIIIPVFLIVTAIFIDMGINSYNEKKFKGISKEIVKTLLDNENLKNVNYDNEDKIVEELKEQAIMLYDANDITSENLVITIGYGNEITLFNTYKHYSFINSLFGRGNGMREINVEITGFIKDGEKIIEFKGETHEDK